MHRGSFSRPIVQLAGQQGSQIIQLRFVGFPLDADRVVQHSQSLPNTATSRWVPSVPPEKRKET